MIIVLKNTLIFILLFFEIILELFIFQSVIKYEMIDIRKPPKFQNLNHTLQKRGYNIPQFYKKFYGYFPSNISLENKYIDGTLPRDSEIMKNLINHTREIFNYSCPPDTKLIIFMISNPINFLLRRDIRESFGKNNKKFKYENLGKNAANYSHCLLFSIGYKKDQNINQMVDYESYINKDIIRIPLLDGYYKLSQKVILTLHVLNQMESNFEMIFKTDDDMFLKINKLVSYILSLDKNIVFIGDLLKSENPIRNPRHKNYISYEDYSDDHFKPFLRGAGYAIRRSIITDIVNRHYMVHSIPNEDVHIGHLVQYFGYNLTHSNRLQYCGEYFYCRQSYIFNIGKKYFRRRYVLKIHKKEYETID